MDEAARKIGRLHLFVSPRGLLGCPVCEALQRGGTQGYRDLSTRASARVSDASILVLFCLPEALPGRGGAALVRPGGTVVRHWSDQVGQAKGNWILASKVKFANLTSRFRQSRLLVWG